MPLITKAELSRSEYQNLIDLLLNKQQENCIDAEWIEVNYTILNLIEVLFFFNYFWCCNIFPLEIVYHILVIRGFFCNNGYC